MSRRKYAYYAVRKGRKRGVFTTWEKCKESVEGYSGAMYRGFDYMDSAIEYLRRKDEPNPDNNASIIAYIDGSYDPRTGVYGYGCIVILPNGEMKKLYGAGNNSDASTLRNITGELLASMHAVAYARKLGYDSIEVRYDYQGIESWATGEWKANNWYTQTYADTISEYMKALKVRFTKVAAHTGEQYNELVDGLAKYAVDNYVRKLSFN